MRREIARDYADGDFTRDPWFLNQGASELAAWGMPLARRIRAVEGLSRVYTPDVCKNLLMSSDRAWIVLPLFVGHWPGTVMAALQIGLDLAEILPVRDEHLFGRLCDPREYFGASTELHVWANLLRAGRPCRRNPRGPLDGCKRPDFGTAVSGTTYSVEIKAVHQSSFDHLAEEVDHRLQREVNMLSGYDLKLLPGQWINDRLRASGHKEILESFGTIAREFREGAEALEAQGAPLGTHPVGAYGFIQISSVQYGIASVNSMLIPKQPAHEAARKVVSHIVDCGSHVRAGAGVGVAFIETANRVNPRLVEEVLAERVHQSPGHLRKLGFVVLRYFWRELGGGTAHEAHTMALPWHRLSRGELLLARDMAM